MHSQEDTMGVPDACVTASQYLLEKLPAERLCLELTAKYMGSPQLSHQVSSTEAFGSFGSRGSQSSARRLHTLEEPGVVGRLKIEGDCLRGL